MKQMRTIFLAVLFLTMSAGAVYGAYPTVRTIAIVAAATLGSIFAVNRFIEPRWDLSDNQRTTENRIRFPLLVSMFALIGILSIGEDGFENLSGALTMWLVAIILIAGIGSLFVSWAKPGK